MREHTAQFPRLDYAHKPYQALTDQALSALARAGDQAASWTLTYRTEGTILKTVRKVYQSQPVHGSVCTAEDLLHYARKAVCDAIVKWNPSRAFSLNAYAAKIAKNEVGERIAANGPIRADRATRSKGLELKEQAQAFASQHGREPDQHELVELTGKSPLEVFRLLSLVNCPVSVEERQTANRELTAGGERLSGYQSDQPGEADATPASVKIVQADLVEQAMSGLDQLTEPQRIVIVATFGLGGQPELTAKQLTAALGLSQHKVDQLRQKGLMLLRAWLQKTA